MRRLRAGNTVGLLVARKVLDHERAGHPVRRSTVRSTQGHRRTRACRAACSAARDSIRSLTRFASASKQSVHIFLTGPPRSVGRGGAGFVACFMAFLCAFRLPKAACDIARRPGTATRSSVPSRCRPREPKRVVWSSLRRSRAPIDPFRECAGREAQWNEQVGARRRRASL